MSYVTKLNQFYGSFFENFTQVALAPYDLVTRAFIGDDLSDVPIEKVIFTGVFCAFFSLIVPILPAITISVAVDALLFGLLVGCLGYPVAALADLFFKAEPESQLLTAP